MAKKSNKIKTNTAVNDDLLNTFVDNAKSASPEEIKDTPYATTKKEVTEDEPVETPQEEAVNTIQVEDENMEVEAINEEGVTSEENADTVEDSTTDTIEEEIVKAEESKDENDVAVEEIVDVEGISDVTDEPKEAEQSVETPVEEPLPQVQEEVKKEEPKKPRRTMREVYGYDFFGMMFD